MNEAMKIPNIATFIEDKKLNIALDDNFIYTQIDAKFWQYALFNGAAILDIKHFLLFFTDEKIVAVGLTLSGDFTDKTVEIPYSDFNKFHYQNGLLQGKLSILVNGDSYLFKIPKFVVIAKWQKVNLTRLRQELWEQLAGQ